MARALFFVLLLLNGVVAAGLAGLLGTRDAPRGESERLTNQLRPEAIRWLSAAELAAAPVRPRPPAETPAVVAAAPVVEAPPPEPPPPPPPAAKPEPAPVPMACVRFVGLDDARTATLSGMARDASPDLAIDDRTELVPTSWWVHVPPEASRRDAERRVAQIRARGVNDLFILLDEGPFQYAISLGLFKTEASARIHLGRLEAKGVEGGIITARGNQIHTLELRGPADALATFASDSAADFPDLTREACAP
ncbi:MAG: SPOR domain-containing protein [Rhodocyclaceae bacterium]|nr:SPOR domain-containing protein [Rhodocyclaceae bacterium]